MGTVGRRHDPEQQVHMIRHHHERVQDDVGTYLSRPQPLVPRDPPRLREHHLSIHDVPEQPLTAARADGHEVEPTSAVVVPQANRATTATHGP